MVSGFANAPISKGLIMIVCLSSLIASVTQTKYQLHLQLYPHILEQHQYWRLFVHYVGFTDSPDVLLSSLILYTCSVAVERAFGTQKFAAFLAVTTLLSTGMLILSLLLMAMPPLSTAFALMIPKAYVQKGVSAAGPFSIIFAIAYQFSRLVPDLWVVRIEKSVWIGDRTPSLLMLTLLLFSNPALTILPCAIGILSSSLYRSDFFLSSSLKAYRLPTWLYSLLSRVLGPLTGETPVPPRSNHPEHPTRRPVEERIARMEQFRQARNAEMQIRGSLTSRLTRRAAIFGRRQANEDPVLPTTAVGLGDSAVRVSASNVSAAQDGTTTPSQSGLRSYIARYNLSRRAIVSTVPPVLPSDDASEAINESSIGSLQAMFPGIARANVVQALQVSDGSQAQAIERLLLQQRGVNTS